jgi:hypothetical protein
MGRSRRSVFSLAAKPADFSGYIIRQNHHEIVASELRTERSEGTSQKTEQIVR